MGGADGAERGGCITVGQGIEAYWSIIRRIGGSSDVPLNIKDPEVYQLARQVAELTGETLTDAVRGSLRERLQREERARRDPLWIERLREISDRCAARPVIDSRSDDELVGYDEFGVPASHGD